VVLDDQLKAAFGSTLEIARHRGPEPAGIVILVRVNGETIAQAETAFMGLPRALKKLASEWEAYRSTNPDVKEAQIQTYSRSVTLYRANVINQGIQV